MKLPEEALVIPPDKLTAYLLIYREHNDKSKFLAQAGFTAANPHALEAEIRRIAQDNEAIADRQDEYGTFYRVAGTLHGTIGSRAVITIWLHIASDDVYRFITLKPDKE